MGKRLCFVLKMQGFMESMRELHSRFLPNGRYVLNRTEWRGKEPRSCAVTNVATRPHSAGDPGPVIIDIEVTYRPKGETTYVGDTKYDGWTAMMLDKTSDGVLLDGHGQPLKDGDPPVYLPFEVYDDVEFNDLDFGELFGEFDASGVKHTTAEAVMEDLQASGRFGGRTTFVAPHRSRPLKKIILSGQPSSEFIDGFGTHIFNINNTTANLGHVLVEELTKLMCDFIEGKVSIKSIENDSLVYVDLSDSLVDCAPNEDGMDSFFEILHLHTPPGFLDDLAKRLMSKYAVDVEVIDGKRGGFVLRRVAKND